MFRSQVGAAILLLSAAGATYSCSADQGPGAATPRLQVPDHIFADAPSLAGRPELREKIRAAEARYMWVSRIHSEIVREAAAARRKWPKQEWTNRARTCELALTLTLKYAPQINVAAGNPAGSNAENWPMLEQAAKGTACAAQAVAFRPPVMSVFTARPLAAVAMPQVSSALQHWLYQLQIAYEGSGLYGQDILNAMDNVIVSASSALSAAEFAELMAAANLGITSLAEWQAVYDSGGFPSGTRETWSVFAPQYGAMGSLALYNWLSARTVSPVVKKMGIADTVGCMMAFARGGGAAGCAGFGGLASVAAF